MERPSPKPPLHRTASRWLRRVGVLLLAVYVLYLLAGNLFLNTALGPWSVNRKPDRFAMHWGPALTWWPGEVVLWKVSVRGQVSRTVWAVQAARASGHVSLLNLVHKELYVPRLRADEVTGRVEHVAMEIPPPRVRPGGWLLNFPAITTDSLRGGRIDALTLEGDGAAQVGFTKRLRGGPAALLASTATFKQLRVVQDRVALLQDATMQARFAMTPTTRAQAEGAQKLRHARIEFTLAGDTPALSARLTDAGRLALSLQPGQGRVQGSLALEGAAVRPGGALSWRMPVTLIDPQGRTHRSTLGVQFSADQDLHLRASMPAQSDGVLSLDADLHADGTAIPLDSFRPLLPRTSGHLAGQWQFSSLKWVTALFVDAPWLSLEGAGRVEGDVTLDHGVLAPGSRLTIPHLQARADVLGQRVTGAASAQARLTRGHDGRPHSEVDVTLSQFSIAALDTLSRPYVRGDDLQLHTESDPDLAKARQSLRARATFHDARVPDLRAYNRFLPNDHLRFDGGAGRLSGTLDLDAAGNAASGRLQASAAAAQVTAAGLALRADVDVDLRLERADLARQRFEVDGTRMALRQVSFAHRSNARAGWWARVDLPKARLQVEDGRVNVGGQVQARMKDVGFLLDLFSQDRDYPAWMIRLVDDGTVRARAKVRWRQDDLVLDQIDASNDRFDLLGRFRLRGQQAAQGDLYARWGVLGTAVELREGQHSFHVLGARRWYDAQPAYLP